jgi:hypothetical protein
MVGSSQLCFWLPVASVLSIMDDPQSSTTNSNPEEPPQRCASVLESRRHAFAIKPTGSDRVGYFVSAVISEKGASHPSDAMQDLPF